MATIDPNIALGVKPLQVENPMAQYAMLSQLQTGQNQNALAQYQLSAAQRTDQKANFLNESIAKNTDLTTGKINQLGVYSDLAKGGFGSAIPELQTKFSDIEHKENVNKKNVVDTTAAAIKNIREKASDLQFNPSDDNVRAHAQDAVLHGVWTQAQADQNVKLALALPMDQRPAYFAKQGLDAEKRVTTTETNRANLQKEETAKGQLKVSQGQLGVSQGQLSVAQQRLANENNVDLQSKLAEAKSVGTTFGKNKATAIAALPGAIANASEAIRLIDEMVGKPEIRDKKGKIIQNATEPHAGFNTYVGATLTPGLRFIEGTDTAAFELRQKQIEGKAFLEAFNTLRGGGSITEKEGEKGTAAIMRMNKASSPDEYKTAARELQDVLRNGIQIAKTKAGATPGIAPPSGFVPD